MLKGIMGNGSLNVFQLHLKQHKHVYKHVYPCGYSPSSLSLKHSEPQPPISLTKNNNQNYHIHFYTFTTFAGQLYQYRNKNPSAVRTLPEIKTCFQTVKLKLVSKALNKTFVEIIN